MQFFVNYGVRVEKVGSVVELTIPYEHGRVSLTIEDIEGVVSRCLRRLGVPFEKVKPYFDEAVPVATPDLECWVVHPERLSVSRSLKIQLPKFL